MTSSEHSSPTKRTEVLIVGGGPVGLATAMELVSHGIDCVVVEPRQTVSMTRPRAKTTSARTMELFRRWSFADEIRKRAPIAVGWSSDIAFCTTATGREIARLTGVLGLDLVDSDLASEPGQQVAQPVVEQALRDVLAESPRCRLMLGWQVLSVENADGAVEAVISDDCEHGADNGEVDAGGVGREPIRIRAEFLVGADGARSLVRSAIGAAYSGGNAGLPNLSVVFRSHGLAEHLVGAPALHYWVLNPAASGVVGPLDLADTWWAIATGRPQDDSNADPAAIVRALVGREIPVEVLGTDPWQARTALVDRYRSGRMFLVGDAAHQNPPWGGHGFNTGVGDAVNLGWKLAAVLRGWAPPEVLDSYESERRPVAEQTIAIAAANAAVLPTDLSAMAAHDDLGAIAALSERIRVAKRPEFYCTGLVLGYSYGRGGGSQTSTWADFRPVALPGNRLPHRWISPGHSLYDLLGPGLSLLGDRTRAEPLIEAAASSGVPLASVPDVGIPSSELFGAELVLVRPDQHIAWLGDRVTATEAPQILAEALTGFG